MRSLLLLIALLFAPLAAQAGQVHSPDPSGADCWPDLSALLEADSLMGNLLADDMDQAFNLAEGAYIWQQPGVALTITGQWNDPAEPPQLWLTESMLHRFFIAQHDLKFSTPFFLPGEVEYNNENAVIPEMICLLDADDALIRFQQHYANYLQWVSFNEGMPFIEPELSRVDITAAVVFIHAGGAVELYYVLDADRGTRLAHFMVYDYFSA